MTIQFLTPIDMVLNEVRNHKLHVLAADPGALEGQIYYNSTSHSPKFHNGTAWIDSLLRANHSGTQPWSTISGTPTTIAGYGITDLATIVQAYRLDQFAVPTGPLNVNSQRIINVANPTSGQDALPRDFGLARANHTGTQLWATITGTPTTVAGYGITDLASIVQAYRLDQFAAPTAAVSMGGQRLTNVSNPSAGTDALNMTYGLARANHTGTQLAATISDLLTTRLSAFAAPNADVPWGSFKITGLADPANPQDAVTKAYADSIASGLTDYKASVRAATTANITLSAPQTIDGVSVIAGDRVLVKNQTTSATNGIYTVAAGAWVRSLDADSSAEFTSGMYVFVSEGTTQASSSWVLSTPDPINLGVTSPITFVQFSGAGQLTAGNGITKTGNTLSVNIDSTMFQFATGQLQLTPLYQTRKVAAACTASAQQSILHNFNTKDVNVTVYRVASPYDVVYCDVEMLDLNNVQIRFATAPTVGQYRVVVVG